VTPVLGPPPPLAANFTTPINFGTGPAAMPVALPAYQVAPLAAAPTAPSDALRAYSGQLHGVPHFAQVMPVQGPPTSRSEANRRSARALGEVPGSPHMDAPDEYRDRRPTDPFFYPTTVNPLTGLGLTLIEQTTPPPRIPTFDGYVRPGATPGPQAVRDGRVSPAREESGAGHLFVPAPVHSFTDQPEEMQLLQQQNDSLARHIQALEHAKSLAAVQSAQALHKIRARQEQLDKEARDAVRKAKEMQSDFSPYPPGTPSGAALGDRLTIGTDGRDTPSSPYPPVLEGPRTSLPSGTGRGTPPPGADRPLWSQEAWQSGTSPTPTGGTARGLQASGAIDAGVSQTMQGQWQSGDSYGETASHDRTAEAILLAMQQGPRGDAGYPPKASTEQSLPTVPCLGAPADLAPNRRAPGGIGDLRPHGPPSLSPTPQAPHQGYEAPPPAPLPAEDVPSTDVEAMANRILSAHQAPGRADQGPVMLPSGQPYVDALGNPLELKRLQLPNIKDDAPEQVLPDLRGYSAGERLPASLDALGAAGAGAGRGGIPLPPDADVSTQQDLTSFQAPLSARGGHERAAVALAHERAPASARGAGSERRASASPGADTSGGGAGDAAAGSAAAPSTPPTPAGAITQRSTSRARQDSARERIPSARGERPRRTGGSSGEEAPSGSASVPQSEEMQAELEECLDTIRWCASSVTRESLQDVKNTGKPAPVVKDVLETVALLLGQTESRWDKLKRFVGSPTFLDKIQRLNFQQNVTREQFKKLRERLGHPDFDEELIKTVCVPVVPLAMWCRAIGVYLSKTKFKGGGEIRPVAAAGAAAQSPSRQQGSGGSRATTSGAYMIFEPDIETLSAEELRSVPELSISRPAVGKITFHGNTDCTGLDFEHIVRLEIGEVLVYPDSQQKPPIGTGLNKAATVTMYQCWPPNGSKLLQDPKSQDRYKKKIKSMTEEKRARFIDYDCNTGVWKFSVDHF